MSDVSLSNHPFRVKPGQELDLNNWPTEDQDLFPISKSEGKDLFKSFDEQVDQLQAQFYAEGKHRLLVVFQAMDTGGKDGTIRTVFEKADPQGTRVAAFKKPSSLELAHDYLWRIHRQTPKKGETVIFNRSHYEDIIAVRVRDISRKASGANATSMSSISKKC